MPGLFDRFRSAADLLRPRTFFRTLARVDALADTARELTGAVDALRIQNERLLAIQRLDWEQRDLVPRVVKELDAARIRAHVEDAIGAATVERDPFPHIVVDGWLPDAVYQRVLDAIPPSVFFDAERDPAKQRMIVPFDLAPIHSRVVWEFVADTIVGRVLYQALNAKFRPAICDYVRTFCSSLPDDIDLTLHPSDGRIMLRRPGYTLNPHRDPKWGFVTGLMYLAREGDNEGFGTQLYRVRDDADAPSGSVYYLDPSRCELARTVPYRPNSLLVFLNSGGAHGAFIPADAQPPGLERFLYQFRLGPSSKVIKRLLQHMPPDKAATWSGAKADRAAGY